MLLSSPADKTAERITHMADPGFENVRDVGGLGKRYFSWKQELIRLSACTTILTYLAKIAKADIRGVIKCLLPSQRTSSSEPCRSVRFPLVNLITLAGIDNTNPPVHTSDYRYLEFARSSPYLSLPDTLTWLSEDTVMPVNRPRSQESQHAILAINLLREARQATEHYILQLLTSTIHAIKIKNFVGVFYNSFALVLHTFISDDESVSNMEAHWLGLCTTWQEILSGNHADSHELSVMGGYLQYAYQFIILWNDQQFRGETNFHQEP